MGVDSLAREPLQVIVYADALAQRFMHLQVAGVLANLNGPNRNVMWEVRVESIRGQWL